ncbi:GatB/YqeY domain-containing protein [Motiliproteus sediminis]|uniref:GatB/YqeY domain-containing protein n=1 Tax=Motiliproteus sediminis TaxID=1468178 RepID=UPI001AEF8037|nr:GatB/YqeY domain-containing protein [Motiliproteus sediminis]
MSDCPIKQALKDAQKAAMRAKDKPRLTTLRGMLAELKRVEVDERIELDDERVLVILDKMQKQRRDSISQFEAAGRDDLAEVEKNELEVIKTFLPAQLTDEEIDQLIDAAIAATGASTMKDMGPLMAQLKPQLQGRADIAAVSKRIKARLG